MPSKNAIPTFPGKQAIQQVKHYCHREKQPTIINQYNPCMYIGGADHMDQNIQAFMINLRTKKWWWPLFRFAVDVAVNNAYQIYRQSHVNLGEYRLDALSFC